MADIDAISINVTEKDIVRYVFWTQLWPRIKDRRWKASFKVFGIELRPSIKVSSLRDEFEAVFGKDPTGPVL